MSLVLSTILIEREREGERGREREGERGREREGEGGREGERVSVVASECKFNFSYNRYSSTHCCASTIVLPNSHFK